MKKEQVTHSETETVAVAEEIAKHLKGGEIFLLESDLGGGKTAFTRGLARGLGSKDEVSSPTFTLSHLYKGKCDLHHYDLYRLGEIGIMSEELREVIDEGSAIVAIEWPYLAEASLPIERLVRVSLVRQKNAEDDRSLSISCPETLSYLFTGTEEEQAC